MIQHKYGDVEFERRAFPRFTIHLPFAYEMAADLTGEGVTNNASVGGLQVYLPERLQVEDQLRFKMKLPEGHANQYIMGLARVVWIQESALPAPQKYKIGLSLLDISPQDMEILKYFEQIWLNQSS